MALVLGGFDPPAAIGVGALATALVTVTGYMLFNARDSDRRVDDAQKEIGKVLVDQRDEARLERDKARADCENERRWRAQEREQAAKAARELRAELSGVYNERDAALEQVRVLQARLAREED